MRVGAGFIGGIFGGYLQVSCISYFKICEITKLGERVNANINYSIFNLNYWWINHGIYYRDPNNGIYFIINELFQSTLGNRHY